MRKVFYWQTVIWTALGLLSGLFYREFTKHHGVSGTQLALVHAHTLVLGTVLGLVFMALLPEVRGRLATWFAATWNAGLAITAGGLLVKGMLQVQGKAAADSAAIAGISGTGHMLLSTAFVLLMVLLRPGRRPATADSTAGPVGRNGLRADHAEYEGSLA